MFHESYVSEDTSVSGRGDGPVSFVAALILAIAATLCKEVGATVFLLIAGAELVLFLEKAISMMFQQRAAQHGIRGEESLRWSYVSSLCGHHATEICVLLLNAERG